MKTVLHRAEERGASDLGWLQSRFSFSFADWYEPTRMGFGALRVINDDRIAPGGGFPMHSHADMEIITIVERGAVAHEDNMGNQRTVRAGEVQVMSAGTGVTHAEFNASDIEPLELFQIWILPDERGHKPRYEEGSITAEKNELQVLASGDESDSALFVHQDARVFRGSFAGGESSSVALAEGHGAYLFVVSGAIEATGQALGPRDALGVWEADEVSFTAAADSTVLVFDVPM